MLGLDKVRKANFRKLLPPDAQVFATGTAYPAETESAIWETFEVNAGTFIKAIRNYGSLTYTHWFLLALGSLIMGMSKEVRVLEISP